MVFSRAATACIRRRWAAIVRATAIRDADISLYLWCAINPAGEPAVGHRAAAQQKDDTALRLVRPLAVRRA